LASYGVSEGALMVHFMTVGDNMLLSFRNFKSGSRILTTILALLALLPSGLVAINMFKNSFMEYVGNNLYRRMLYITIMGCCFAPLLLVFIGADNPLWMAAVITNLFIVGIVGALLHYRNGNREITERVTSISSKILVGVIMFSLTVGPIRAVVAPETLHRLVPIAVHLISAIF